MIRASGCGVTDRADGMQAVHARQLQIHQRDVGPMLQELLDRLFAVAGLRDDGHVGLQADDADDAFTHQTMIVDAEYANRRPRHAGNRSAAGGADSGATATTAVPWPGWLEIRTWPPIFSARSFMFIRPRCAPVPAGWPAGTKPVPSSDTRKERASSP